VQNVARNNIHLVDLDKKVEPTFGKEWQKMHLPTNGPALKLSRADWGLWWCSLTEALKLNTRQEMPKN